MAKDKLCVFCGEKPGPFRSDLICCVGVPQTCCKACLKELEPLSEEERCRRALRLGLADLPKMLEEYVTRMEEAEKARPACLRCGGKLKFGQMVSLDASPYTDSILCDTAFEVVPAYCGACGKMEFYDPNYAKNDKIISYLVKKDTEEKKREEE